MIHASISLAILHLYTHTHPPLQLHLPIFAPLSHTSESEFSNIPFNCPNIRAETVLRHNKVMMPGRKKMWLTGYVGDTPTPTKDISAAYTSH